jgi:hypothetical protein
MCGAASTAFLGCSFVDSPRLLSFAVEPPRGRAAGGRAMAGLADSREVCGGSGGLFQRVLRVLAPAAAEILEREMIDDRG